MNAYLASHAFLTPNDQARLDYDIRVSKAGIGGFTKYHFTEQNTPKNLGQHTNQVILMRSGWYYGAGGAFILGLIGSVSLFENFELGFNGGFLYTEELTLFP